jgi:hypothetical protein
MMLLNLSLKAGNDYWSAWLASRKSYRLRSGINGAHAIEYFPEKEEKVCQ